MCGRPASGSLLENQESGFHAVVGDPVPHDAGLAAGDGVLEVDHLSGVQERVGVLGAKSAVTVVDQAAGDFLARRILEGQPQRALTAMTAFGTAFGG